ncbi:hypothetical protein GGR54DRAFT_90667 [Hypoxylon sp. NC1633]|nr:hypothetical protein GGR54DRAFT_90667 [Hypoxylon sp. NC1633]
MLEVPNGSGSHSLSRWMIFAFAWSGSLQLITTTHFFRCGSGSLTLPSSLAVAGFSLLSPFFFSHTKSQGRLSILNFQRQIISNAPDQRSKQFILKKHITDSIHDIGISLLQRAICLPTYLGTVPNIQLNPCSITLTFTVYCDKPGNSRALSVCNHCVDDADLVNHLWTKRAYRRKINNIAQGSIQNKCWPTQANIDAAILSANELGVLHSKLILACCTGVTPLRRVP